jgi:hypothetical protein
VREGIKVSGTKRLFEARDNCGECFAMCQITLEQSLRDNRPHALVQMATGSGNALARIGSDELGPLPRMAQ